MERENSPEIGSNVWVDVYHAVKEFSDSKKDVRFRSRPTRVRKIEANDVRYELQEFKLRDRSRFIFTMDRKMLGLETKNDQEPLTLKNINWLAESDTDFVTLTIVLHEKGVSMYGRPAGEEEDIDLDLPQSDVLAKMIEDLVISVIDTGRPLNG